MQPSISRQSVDLSNYPDLVIILLGLKLRSLKALPTFLSVGRGLSALRKDPPDGLLADQQFLFEWNHVGIRQYWRDPEALETFTRQAPHAGWWKSFLADPSGCGFWHETYSSRGGVEAIYINMPQATGLGRFAPARAPTGSYQTSRERLRLDATARAGAQGSGA